MKKTFTLTKDHIKLLSKMYVEWNECESGAPRIDPKNTYGNSDIELDIAEILNWKLFENRDGELELTKKQSELALKLHRETETALQICLCTQSFKPGKYQQQVEYRDTSWKKI